MERPTEGLQERFERLLRETAEAAVALDQANGTIQGVPHYSVIELRAHELGQQLSRQIQHRHLAAMVSHHAPRAACPGCGTSCSLEPVPRTVRSVDGAVAVPERRGTCPRCRRAFFPPAGDARL